MCSMSHIYLTPSLYLTPPPAAPVQMGQGPPGREAIVSEAEKKNMMAYYYNKQEEMKVIGETTHVYVVVNVADV